MPLKRENLLDGREKSLHLFYDLFILRFIPGIRLYHFSLQLNELLWALFQSDS